MKKIKTFGNFLESVGDVKKNINDLEDFVQLMIEQNPSYRNRILNLYTSTSDKIIQNRINGIEFSREDEINNCINSINELLKK